jgi:hypothetical protein
MMHKQFSGGGGCPAPVDPGTLQQLRGSGASCRAASPNYKQRRALAAAQKGLEPGKGSHQLSAALEGPCLSAAVWAVDSSLCLIIDLEKSCATKQKGHLFN